MTDCDCKDLQAKCVLLEERDERIREVMQLRFDENAMATKLASAETNRRLDMLNGEAGRLSSMQATYLPRELYEQNQRAMADSIERNRRAVMLAVLTAVLSLIVNWILKGK